LGEYERIFQLEIEYDKHWAMAELNTLMEHIRLFVVLMGKATQGPPKEVFNCITLIRLRVDDSTSQHVVELGKKVEFLHSSMMSRIKN